MAALLGTSSLFLSPSINSAPASKLPFKFPLSSRPHVRPLAVVNSVNSLLSEEAFKGLGGFDIAGEDGEYGSGLEGEEGQEGEFVGGEEELAIVNLGLPEVLVKTLEKRGITHLFPIQRAVLVPALEGQDLIARAKTGTGKTLAFGIPIIKRLTEEDEARTARRSGRKLPRALVLAPTRELAKQVEKEIKESAPHLHTVCVYGGVSYSIQQNALSRGVDVVVGTPGRLIDLINNDNLRLDEVKFLVLDEADQMLAVGFEEDVETILEKLPEVRQSMLFSATMPGWVKKLARKHLTEPLTIDLVGDQDEKLAEGIKLFALPSTATSKRTMLSDIITVHAKGGKTIVFTQTKRDADDVSNALTNSIASEALHGDISQHQRERTLNGFRQGKFTVLVATDVASRGLDIPNVDLIIHYELPNDPETFVHRSGRTGRAGKVGTAILMFTSNQRRTIKSLERDVGCKFEFLSPPTIEQVLDASAEHVAATLRGVHPQSVEYFMQSAKRLEAELGETALAAALAQMSGFARPPSSRSLISHEQGYVTLQLIRDPGMSRGFFSQRSVMGFLADVYSDAADEIGKIQLLADDRVQGAVFDLPEEIANQLLTKELPPGNTITKISKLPALQDDGPATDFYGRFSNSERSRGGRGGGGGSRFSRGGGGGSRSSWGSGGRDSGRSSGGSRFGGRGGGRSSSSFGDDDDWSPRGARGGRGGGRGGGRSFEGGARGGRSSSFDDLGLDDWSMGGGARRSSGRTFGGGGGNRSFDGACFKCGRSGHRANDCPGN
ncbi:hypothetical protein LUZ60_011277 [Juncus effusus]|nr:hypothetical protein LUZ60_011277 [Juncus effusus]